MQKRGDPAAEDRGSGEAPGHRVKCNDRETKRMRPGLVTADTRGNVPQIQLSENNQLLDSFWWFYKESVHVTFGSGWHRE